LFTDGSGKIKVTRGTINKYLGMTLGFTVKKIAKVITKEYLLKHSTMPVKILTTDILVGTLKDGYIRNIPLPRVPQVQSTSLYVTRMNPSQIRYLPILRIPSWSDFLTKSPSGLSGYGNGCNIPFFPVTFM